MINLRALVASFSLLLGSASIAHGTNAGVSVVYEGAVLLQTFPNGSSLCSVDVTTTGGKVRIIGSATYNVKPGAAVYTSILRDGSQLSPTAKRALSVVQNRSPDDALMTAQATWLDETVKAGKHSYTVVAYYNLGIGVTAAEFEVAPCIVEVEELG
jgi:hypothetical protein